MQNSAEFLTRICRLGALFALVLTSCDEPKEQVQERTEPWLKDGPADEAERKSTLVRYRLAAGQTLSIALPTRKHKPTGELGKIDGHVDFDLRNLAQSRGRLHFALDRIEMDEPNPNEKPTKDDGKRPEADASRTVRALRWLGLGEKVSPDERAEVATAVFQFDSLRAVSHQSAHIGARKKTDDKAEQRKVYATADGELTMRGLSVMRQFPTVVLFHYSEQATTKNLPDSVEVTLRGSIRVPLAEYEIVPRGPDGHAITEEEKLLGSEIGTNVVVSGTLKLEKVGAQ